MTFGWNTSDALGWGSLALINAALARIDGRSVLKYFVGSLVVGPVMTILLAATAEDERGHLHQVDLLRRRKSSP